jgi:ATP-binding cassette subfamily B protein
MSEVKKTTKDIVLPNSPWRYFIYVSLRHKFLAIGAISAVVAASTLSASTSYLFKLVIDAVENSDMSKAMFWGMTFPIVGFIVQILYRTSGYLGAFWTNRSIKTSNDILAEYLLKHSHNYYINRFAGSISSKIGSVHNAISVIIPDFLWALLSSFVSFAVTFVLLLTVNHLTAYAFLLLIFILIIVNQIFAPKKIQLAKNNAEASTLLQGKMVDIFSNISTVRQYVQNKFELDNIKDLTNNKYNSGLRNWLYTEKLLLVNGFILSVFSIGIFWLLVTRWGDGYITTGDFVLVVSLIFNVTGSLLFVGRAFNAVSSVIGEMREGLGELL